MPSTRFLFRPATPAGLVLPILWFVLAVPTGLMTVPAAPAQGKLQARILSAETRQPVACTVTLVDSAGRTETEGDGFRGGFRSSGTFTKHLPPGRTKIRVTRGPEFKAVEREIELRAGETNLIEIQMERQVDLRRRGWFAGDSHVHMIHGEKTIPVNFDQVALAARAEDLQYLSLGHAWTLDDPTPERLEAELARRSTPDCTLTWGLEAPKNYFKGDAGRCLGHCWTLGMRGRSPSGSDVIASLLQASAWDYESQKPSFANFESHALIHAQGGAVFYTHPARWWTGPWGGQGGYPKQDNMRVSNMAVELPLDVLVGPTFDGARRHHRHRRSRGGSEVLPTLVASAQSRLPRRRHCLVGLPVLIAPAGLCREQRVLYTFVEGGFSIAGAARAAAQGRTFATTGPLLLISVDGRPPGSAWPADGGEHQLRIEAWSSGAVTDGLERVEILRNGQVFQKHALAGQQTSCHTNLVIREDRTSWYCVRAFGPDERRQRAISGAFYFDQQPWLAPEPVKARIHARVIDAASGRSLDATLTEVSYLGTTPQLGVTHRLNGGAGELTIPAHGTSASACRWVRAGHLESLF